MLFEEKLVKKSENLLNFLHCCGKMFHAGGLFRVEKVKPDPLNLLANTNVGKQSIRGSI